MSQHPIMHAANAVVSVPILGWFTGHFQGVVATLAALAGLILYSLEIYDWIKKNRSAP